MNRRNSLSCTLFLACALIFVACKKPKSGVSRDEPDMPTNPPNYAKSSNDELAYLGRVLFYDKKLSSDNTIRCASCHEQSKAFADDESFSTGVYGQKTIRNAPTIFPKNGRMFWDGRAKSLNDMVIMPITNDIEMNIQSFDDLCTKLSQTTYYPKLFKKAFGDEAVTKDKIANALKEFVTNFNFTQNRFKSSQGLIPTKLKDDEVKGKDLFFGKAKCSECHHTDTGGFGMSNGYGVTDEAHNIGLEAEPNDKGVGEITKKENECGQFMMPVLLNVELTAPYMHDGRFATLEEVVEHYNSDIKMNANLDWRLKDFSDYQSLADARGKLDKNRDGQIDNKEAPNRAVQNLNLSGDEKAQLVKFLKTLTDKDILTDKKFSDPFVR